MPSTDPPINVDIDTDWLIRRVFLVCLSINLFIAVANVFLNYYEWIPWSPLQKFFDITREDSLANWWSATQTLLVALTLWAIVLVRKRAHPQEEDPATARGWTLIAIFFTYMALDDGSRLHERLGSTYRRIAGVGEPGVHTAIDWFPSYYWLLAIAPFFILMGLFMADFLFKRLTRPHLRWMIFASLALLAVAIGLDFLEGTNEDVFDERDVKHFMRTLEEWIEMLANTIFLCVFLRVLADDAPRIDLRFR